MIHILTQPDDPPPTTPAVYRDRDGRAWPVYCEDGLTFAELDGGRLIELDPATFEPLQQQTFAVAELEHEWRETMGIVKTLSRVQRPVE